jgi:hypothetical protein
MRIEPDNIKTFKVSLPCECKHTSFHTLLLGIPAEMGKIVVCMHCLRKYIYWNSHFYKLGEEVITDGRRKEDSHCGGRSITET